MNLGMNRLGEFIVGHRLAVAIGLLLITGVLGWRASLLQEDLSFETLYPPRCPEKDFCDRFTEEFGNVKEMIAVAIAGDDLFKPEFLVSLRRAHKAIEGVDHVDVVYSLADIPYVRATEDGFDVKDFIAKLPENDKECRELAEKGRNYSLYRGRLLSADGRYTSVVIQMNKVVGRPCDPYVAEMFEGLKSEDPETRIAAARNISEVRERAKASLVKGDPRFAEWVDQLGNADASVRERAIKGLGSAGTKAIRPMTVADRRVLIGRIEEIVNKEIPKDYKTYITGINVVERDYARILRWDKAVFQSLVIVVLIISFYLSFRSWRDTFVGMFSLTLCAVCSLGMVQLMGGVIDIINSVVFLMVLVVGTSNVIHMTNAFYKAWRADDGADAGRKAAARMVDSVGLACLMASLTTACGFGSLYSARIGTIMHFGLNMATAVMVTYIVSKISIPLMLSMTRKIPEFRARGEDAGYTNRLAVGIVDLIARRRAAVLTVCTLGLGILFTGVALLYVDTHAISEMPANSPTMVNMRAMDHMAGFIGFDVSVRATGPQSVIDPAALRKVDDMVAYLRKQPETLRSWSIVDNVKTMNQAANGGKAVEYAVPSTAEAVDQYLLLYGMSKKGKKEIEGLLSQDRKWLRIASRVHDVGAKPYLALRDRVEQMGRELFPGGEVEVRVSGDMYLLHRSMNNMAEDMISSMIWAFVFVGILMAFALRSFRLGLVAIPPNIAPMLATLGFMGFTGIPLRVGTLVVFSLGLGIAVDNTIHYLLSYREARGNFKTARECTRFTFAKVADSMILSSIILMAGFCSTLFATFKSIWQMGVLCAFTVLIALLSDLLVTPILAELVERWNVSSKRVADGDAQTIEKRRREATI